MKYSSLKNALKSPKGLLDEKGIATLNPQRIRKRKGDIMFGAL